MKALSSILYSGHKAAVYCLAHGMRDGQFLSAGGDGLVVKWITGSPDDGKVISSVGVAVFSLLVDRDRNVLLIGTGAGRLHVIDLSRNVEVQIIEFHRKGIFRMISHRPGEILCAGGDGVLSAWRWKHGTAPELELTRQIPLCEEKLRDIALSPTGDRIAVACGDGIVREFEPVLLNETLRTAAHPNGCTSVCYHPAKPLLMSGGKDGLLRAWHLEEQGREVIALPAHKGAVYAMAIDPEGKVLASAGRDSIVRLWKTDSLDLAARSDRGAGGHSHSVNNAIWCGSTLFTASDDRGVRAWSVQD